MAAPRKPTIFPFDVQLGAAFPRWCARHAPLMTRVSLAIIFVWFGLLKVCGVSPAAELVSQTFFFIPARILLPALGIVEIAIGLCFVFRRLLPLGLCLLALHLPGTFLSYLVVPDRCFVSFPFVLTVEGEFVLKNLLLISAALFLAGTLVREGSSVGRSPRVEPDPRLS